MKPDHISQRMQRQCGVARHLVDPPARRVLAQQYRPSNRRLGREIEEQHGSVWPEMVQPGSTRHCRMWLVASWLISPDEMRRPPGCPVRSLAISGRENVIAVTRAVFDGMGWRHPLVIA